LKLRGLAGGKRVEAVAETLKLAKISSILYHGGMNDDEREKAQNEFMQGRRDIVVATNAFGMGVDKADVRTVCHEAVLEAAPRKRLCCITLEDPRSVALGNEPVRVGDELTEEVYNRPNSPFVASFMGAAAFYDLDELKQQ
jgi:hypothetical protein